MKTLVLTHYRPHRPEGGAPLRNWQNIQALAALGDVDVVSVGLEGAPESVPGVRRWVTFPSARRSAGDAVRTRCWPLRPGVYPAIDRYHQQAVARWLSVEGANEPWDVAVIETISLASYLDDLKAVARRVVFDAHNVESALHEAAVAARSDAGASAVRRAKDLVLNRRMEAAERRVVTRADLVWACSRHDSLQLWAMYGRRSGVTVVPNAVDVEAYRRSGAIAPGSDWTGTPLTLVYPGSLAYPPNDDAARRLIGEVVPLLRARGLHPHVVLVGRDPGPALLDLARRDPAIVVTGRVDSVVPHLEQACIVTLPIALGSGTRLKILEAFAVGRPVVSTAKGAEGIEAADGEHLLLRESAADIADAVVALWQDASLRGRLCARALELVRCEYSWSVARRRIAESLGVRAPEPELASV